MAIKIDVDYFNKQIASPMNNENEVLEQQKELESIYKKLLLDKFDLRLWIEDFKKFSDKHKRIFYSILSGMILNERKEDNIPNLELNLTSINSKISKTKDDASGLIQVHENTYQLYYKFFDHCSLAIAQRRIYKQSDDLSKKRTEEIVKNQMKNAIDKRVAEYEKNITGQLIGLVSIFTALSFVIFGGINVLGSLMEKIKTTDTLRLLFIADIWFLTMFNVLFVFVKFITLLTKLQTKILWIYFAIINSVLVTLLFLLCRMFGINLYQLFC